MKERTKELETSMTLWGHNLSVVDSQTAIVRHVLLLVGSAKSKTLSLHTADPLCSISLCFSEGDRGSVPPVDVRSYAVRAAERSQDKVPLL